MALNLNAEKLWEVSSSGIADQTLLTSGKYLDRNIVIKKMASVNGQTQATWTSVNNINGTTTGVDEVTVKVTLPAGYYAGQTIEHKFTDLLPDLNVDATASYILNGMKAYTDTGAMVLGSMPDYSTLETDNISMTAGAGSASAKGSSITLTAQSTKPTSGAYIEVQGSGTVSASYTIAQGYYNGTKLSGSASSSTATKYYTMNNYAMTVATTTVTPSISSTVNASGVYEITGTKTINTNVTTGGYAAKGAGPSGTAAVEGTVAQSKIKNSSGTEITKNSSNKYVLNSQESTLTAGYFPTDRAVSIRSAASISLNLTDKATDITVSDAADANGLWTLTAKSIEGTVSAGTAGWFTSGKFTDGSANVGTMATAGYLTSTSGTGTVSGVPAVYTVECSSSGYAKMNTVINSIAVYNGETA